MAIAGIGVIGISIGISYGLGSAFQFNYTGVHNVLPFLLLGIGVDDLFVIVQSWENIGGPIQDHRSIPEKISLAMRHAGVSVLVTSVTDICAFAIGSATVSFLSNPTLLYVYRFLNFRNLCLDLLLNALQYQ